MGRPQLYTKNGHSMYDMVSLLQKAIRRGDVEVAGYAANELRGRYNAYLWRRLLAISAEDCYGIMTKKLKPCDKQMMFITRREKVMNASHCLLARLLLCSYMQERTEMLITSAVTVCRVKE